MKNLFFKPVIRFMNRLKYPYKLALISGIFLVPICILSYGLLAEVVKDINAVRQEQQGLHIILNLFDLHRDASFLRDNMLMYSRIKDGAKSIEVGREQKQELLNKINKLLDIKVDFDHNDNLRSKIRKLKVYIDSKELKILKKPDATYALYDESANKIFDLIRATADLSGVSMDPDVTWPGQH